MQKQDSNAGSGQAAYCNICGKCGARRIDSQLGLERTPEEYVARLVGVFREVRRVLRDDGTLWLNLGDSFASGKGTCYNPGGGDNSLGQERKAAGAHPLDRGNKSTLAVSGLKPKDLIGIPWRVAFALQADGWWLRSDIIWNKLNPMPESVTDRPTKAHEYIFLMSKNELYYFNAEAINEPATTPIDTKASQSFKAPGGKARENYGTNEDRWKPNGTRNRRSVWTVATQPFAGAHFATFPPKLIEPCILAGCPVGGTVLDPFGGSGTTALVAIQHGRRAVLCDLNHAYLMDLAVPRIEAELAQPPLIPPAQFEPVRQPGLFP